MNLKLSFKAARQTTSAADAAGSGSTPSETPPSTKGKTATTPTSGTGADDKLLTDTGVDDPIDTGLKSDLDLKLEEATEEAVSRKEKLARTRGVQDIGQKKYQDFFGRRMVRAGDDFFGARNVANVERRDVDGKSEDMIGRGFTFAGSGQTVETLQQGIHNIERKRFPSLAELKPDASEEDKTKAKRKDIAEIQRQEDQDELLLERRQANLDRLGNLIRKTGGAAGGTSILRSGEAVYSPTRTFDIGKLGGEEQRFLQTILSSGGSAAQAAPLKSLVDLYNSIRTEIADKRAEMDQREKRRNQLAQASRRFSSQLQALKKADE
jgi:hypothetical protein